MPGRNESCPCGSGKKFKKCCIRKPQPAGTVAVPSAHAAAAHDTEKRLLWPATVVAPRREERSWQRPPLSPLERAWQTRWHDFASQDLDGKIRLYRQTLDEPDLVNDEAMFAMLGDLQTTSLRQGRRRRARRPGRRAARPLPGRLSRGVPVSPRRAHRGRAGERR